MLQIIWQVDAQSMHFNIYGPIPKENEQQWHTKNDFISKPARWEDRSLSKTSLGVDYI